MAKTEQPEKELPIKEAPRWVAEPVFKRLTKAEREAGVEPKLKFWALKYDGKIQKKAHTESERNKLIDFASFCNRRGLVPRPAVQCIADTNLPAPPKRKGESQLPEVSDPG